MALVEVPVLDYGDIVELHFGGCYLEGVDGAAQVTGEEELRFQSGAEDGAAGVARLGAPLVRQLYIGPAGESVFEVPLALAVAKKDDLFHFGEVICLLCYNNLRG